VKLAELIKKKHVYQGHKLIYGIFYENDTPTKTQLKKNEQTINKLSRLAPEAECTLVRSDAADAQFELRVTTDRGEYTFFCRSKLPPLSRFISTRLPEHKEDTTILEYGIIKRNNGAILLAETVRSRTDCVMTVAQESPPAPDNPIDIWGSYTGAIKQTFKMPLEKFKTMAYWFAGQVRLRVYRKCFSVTALDENSAAQKAKLEIFSSMDSFSITIYLQVNYLKRVLETMRATHTVTVTLMRMPKSYDGCIVIDAGHQLAMISAATPIQETA
jgi:hypothetical protein